MSDLAVAQRISLGLDAVVTKDTHALVKVEAASPGDFKRALAVVNASTRAFDKATVGRGDRTDAMFATKLENAAWRLIPQGDFGLGVLYYVCGGMLGGIAAAGVTDVFTPASEGMVVGAALAVGTGLAATPLGVRITEKFANWRRKKAADRLMTKSAPQALASLAKGDSLEAAVAVGEAQHWMDRANEHKALSPEARFVLRDLASRRDELPEQLMTRADTLRQLATIIAGKSTITTSTVHYISTLVDKLEPTERDAVVRAMCEEVAKRSSSQVDYQARHALADLAEAPVKALPAL